MKKSFLKWCGLFNLAAMIGGSSLIYSSCSDRQWQQIDSGNDESDKFDIDYRKEMNVYDSQKISIYRWVLGNKCDISNLCTWTIVNNFDLNGRQIATISDQRVLSIFDKTFRGQLEINVYSTIAQKTISFMVTIVGTEFSNFTINYEKITTDLSLSCKYQLQVYGITKYNEDISLTNFATFQVVSGSYTSVSSTGLITFDVEQKAKVNVGDKANVKISLSEYSKEFTCEIVFANFHFSAGENPIDKTVSISGISTGEEVPEELVIPDFYGTHNYNVVKISDFSSKNIKTVIGNNVLTIENDCFTACSLLEKIKFPNVQKIGTNAFSICKQLSGTIRFPRLLSLGKTVFSWTKIKQLIFDCVKEIGDECFAYMSELEDIDFGTNLKIFKKRMLIQCSKLKSLTIPESLEKMEEECIAVYSNDSTFISCPNCYYRASLKQFTEHRLTMTIDPRAIIFYYNSSSCNGSLVVQCCDYEKALLSSD